jgi:translocation and assembly module TamB
VFDTLSAKRIQLLRTPIGRGDPPADEAQIDFAWPRPPVTMVVEKMLIERMIIEGGILPQDIEARIEGRFSDDDDIQESTLGVTRLDRPGDSINLGTRIDFDAMDISFSLEAAEAPGGLVSELAGLPETEALEITAAAAGNPAELPFTLYADIGQIGIAEGEGVASWQDRIATTFNGAVIPGDKTSGAWRASPDRAGCRADR